MSRAGLLFLALLGAAALSLAACDDDTAETNDYVDQVNEVTSTLQSGLAQVASQTNVDSVEQASEVFDGLAEQINAAAAELDGISPPEEITDLHDRITDDLKTLESEAQGAANEIRDGGAGAIPGVMAQVLVEANRIGSEIDTTISEINSELQE